MTGSQSKLVLGTVQLGMKYGLNNTHGQPTKEESFAILDAALANGIDAFDTAYAYGTAEDVLGEWIQSRKLKGKVKVISKMRPHALNDYPDGIAAVEVVEKELEKSLARLHLDTLDGYLFHSPHYIYLSHMVEGMRKMKEQGRIQNIGVSIYNEGEALQAAELGVDYVQVPYNAFDQRLDATDFFDIAGKNNVTVFARSPFLQGLLLIQPDKLPGHLSYLRPHLEQFIAITKRHGLTPAEAAFRFADVASQGDRIVFGVDTRTQLIEDIGFLQSSSSKSESDFVAEIRAAFKDLNHGAINPSLWSKMTSTKLRL